MRGGKLQLGPNIVFGGILVGIFLAVLIWMNVSFNANNGLSPNNNSTATPTPTSACQAVDANGAQVRALLATQSATRLNVLTLLAQGEATRLVQDNAAKFSADAAALSILDGSAFATIKRIAPQLPSSLANASETAFTVTGAVVAVNQVPTVNSIDDFRFNFTARVDVSAFTLADRVSSVLFSLNLTAAFKLAGLQFDDAGSRWWGKNITSPACGATTVSSAIGDLDAAALAQLVSVACFAMQVQFNNNPFAFAVQLPASLVSPLYGRRGTIVDGSLPLAEAVQNDNAQLNALTLRWMAQIQSLQSMSSAKK